MPERLEEILAAVLDRRQEHTERRRHHIGELNKRATEADARLKRLYDAIESGVADLNDPDLKQRIAILKATRDQAKVDAERAQATLQGSGQTITKAMLARFAKTARERIRIDWRRLSPRPSTSARTTRGSRRYRGSDHGSKSSLLGTLVAAASGKTATLGVRSSVLNWRTGRESTLERLSPSHTFQACAFNHSATCPPRRGGDILTKAFPPCKSGLKDPKEDDGPGDGAGCCAETMEIV